MRSVTLQGDRASYQNSNNGFDPNQNDKNPWRVPSGIFD